MWRILTISRGGLAEAVRIMTFFGVAPAAIFAPYILRRIPNRRANFVVGREGLRRRYVKPLRDHVGAMFPGYAFVHCDGPVACGLVDWAMRGRGALLRAEPLAEPSAISGEWLEALRGLCVVDDKGRALVADQAVKEQWRGAPAEADALREAIAGGGGAAVRMVSGPFEGLHAEIDPLVTPEALAAAMKELDESGRVRVCFDLFGSRRAVDVPREQVDLDVGCRTSQALDHGAQASGPVARPSRPIAKQAAG